MVSKPGLSLLEMKDLKFILSVSSSYYAKILPMYRKSLEHRRLRRAKVKNPKGLRVKVHPIRRVGAVCMPPRVPASPMFPVPQSSVSPQSNTNPRKRSRLASPVEPTAEHPNKKLRPLTDAAVAGVRLLDLLPLVTHLQDSLSLPSHIVLRRGRWFLIRKRGSVSIDAPPSFPEDFVGIKVPLGLSIDRPSK